MRTTAPASRSASSPARMPVRASSSITSRSRGSGQARAAAMSLAASRSPGNFGSGSGFLGMSPPRTGLRGGASGQSHSMIRSGERAQGPQPLPVGVGRQGAFGAGLAGQPDLEVLDVVAADAGHGLDAGTGQDPPGQLAQRG